MPEGRKRRGSRCKGAQARRGALSKRYRTFYRLWLFRRGENHILWWSPKARTIILCLFPNVNVRNGHLFRAKREWHTSIPCRATERRLPQKKAANFGQSKSNFALTFFLLASMMDNKEVFPSPSTRKELACSMDTDPGSITFFARDQRSAASGSPSRASYSVFTHLMPSNSLSESCDLAICP